MMRTSHPGNEGRREGGFVLLDALLCLFITGIAALLIHGSVEAAGKAAADRITAAAGLIEERNILAGKAGPELSGEAAADE